MPKKIPRRGGKPDLHFFGTDRGSWVEDSDMMVSPHWSKRGYDWSMLSRLSRENEGNNYVVDGATEHSYGFIAALHEIVRKYPEVADYWIKFDGPYQVVRDVLGMERMPHDWGRVKFLHGTSLSRWDKIQREGLRPRKQTGIKPTYGAGISRAAPSREEAVYLTTQPNMAKMAAHDAARATGSPGVVLEVSAKGLDDWFAPDEDSGEETAWKSLGRMGSVAYVGTIPPRNLRLLEVHDREQRKWVKQSSDFVPVWALDQAHERLNEHVSDWVFRNDGSAKKRLMAEWKKLPPKQRTALERQVKSVVPSSLMVYRSMRPGDDPSRMGGASVTDDPSTRTGDVHAFEITPKDVMLHYRMKGSWLSSKSYAHEREIILRPDASPKYVGPVGRGKVAARIADIEMHTGREVHERSKDLPVTLYRATPKKGVWLFNVTGSRGDVYRVRLKGIRKPHNIRRMSKAHVLVSCSCPFWRWQGPEHWGKTNQFLYGRPRGTASLPIIRDPKEKHWACKHVLAVLRLARRYDMQDVRPPGGKTASSMRYLADILDQGEVYAVAPDLEAMCHRVADRYLNRKRP